MSSDASLPPEHFAKRAPPKYIDSRAERNEPGRFTWPDGQDGWRCSRCLIGVRVGRPEGAPFDAEQFNCACGKVFRSTYPGGKVRDARGHAIARVWIERAPW
jgi:hypothetical protein